MPEDDPKRQLAETLGYLRKNASRMGTIKQINRRVKETEKFWDQGAEPLLQLAADQISETNNFDRFWKQRRRKLPPTRQYQAAA